MRESELGFGTVSLRFETGVNLFLWLVEASERPLAKRRAFIAHGKKNSRRVRCCIPEGLFRLKFQHLASLCPETGRNRVSAVFPMLAHEATSDARCGNTLRGLPRISFATSAPHKARRTDARRRRRLPRRLLPQG